MIVLLLAAALPLYARIARPPASADGVRPKRARQSARRILTALLVILALGSLIAAGVVYARRPRDAGATPQYIGRSRPVIPDQSSSAQPAILSVPLAEGATQNSKNQCLRNGRHGETGRSYQPDAVLALGDNQYPSGALADFPDNVRTELGCLPHHLPVPGNHEYRTPGARGYYAYFGERAGEPDKGYYSYDLGSWHLIALNSSATTLGMRRFRSSGHMASAGLALASTVRACLLAPASLQLGNHGNDLDLDPLWRILAEGDADLVLSGHDHDYERFTPMNAQGEADPKGLTEFVVGTGGASHYQFHNPEAASAVRLTGRNGVLRLQLTEQARMAIHGGSRW